LFFLLGIYWRLVGFILDFDLMQLLLLADNGFVLRSFLLLVEVHFHELLILKLFGFLIVISRQNNFRGFLEIAKLNNILIFLMSYSQRQNQIILI
jgi:hypothetical protein